jgi:two-component system, LytTR family, sensor kinase
MAQDRARQLILTKVRFKSKLLVRLHGVGALILQLVGPQLVEQPNAPAFLLLIDQQTPALGCDRLERHFQLCPAIAAQTVEHVAGQALGMNTHQGRLAATEIAHAQHHKFFRTPAEIPLEPMNAEMAESGRKIGFGYFSQLDCRGHGSKNSGEQLHYNEIRGLLVARWNEQGAPFMFEQHLVILLVKLAVSVLLASILTRSGAFQRMLMREERTLTQRVLMAMVCAVIFGAGVGIRVVTRDSYQAVDLGLEGSLVMGMLGGYVTGMLAGVLISLPAMFNGELMSMLLLAAVGVLGGLLRDLAPDKEFIWKFTPFPDLAVVRLLRRGDLRLAVFSIGCVGVILLAELLRSTLAVLFPTYGVFALQTNWGDEGPWLTAFVYATTLFATVLPIKVWNSSRNERKLELQQLRLNEARLAALSSQINPHFLFNTLNSVASLIRLDPEQARQVVYKLSKILRRLLRQQDNMTTLREELSFIEDYLAIEMVRFGDKLNFVKDIDPVTLELLVPSMLLQPIVENSIRHGLSAKVEGGTIRVTSRLLGTRLQIQIEDDGVGIPEAKLARLYEQGIGVNNVNERLKVLYGDGYRMWIDSRLGEGTTTGIELPEQTSDTVVGVESLAGRR